MKTVIHTGLATNAALSIGLGFIPNWVRVTNLVDQIQLEWWRRPAVGAPNGISIAAAGDKALLTTAATGISIYNGAGIQASASTSILTPDDRDHKVNVGTFTIGSVANKTGNFDVACDTDFVGAGSLMDLGRTRVKITALSSNGEQANEVTIDEIPSFDGSASSTPTFNVSRISGKNTLYFARADYAIGKGITIGADADVNTDATDTLLIEARL